MIRVTEPINYFREPWYIEWVLKTFAKKFKKVADVKKAQKFAMRDLKAIMEESTDIGTEVDAIIKKDPNNLEIYHKNIEIKNCLEAYWKWVKIYQPKSVVPCKRLYSTVEGQEVSGEPDLIVDDVLVDIKCSKKISIGYWLQVNMYRKLEGLEAKKVAILRLDKETASYEYVIRDYEPSLVDVWIGLMRAYVYYKGEEDGGLDIREEASE